MSGVRFLDMKGDDIITERVYTSHEVSEDHLAVKDPMNGKLYYSSGKRRILNPVRNKTFGVHPNSHH